MKERIIQFLNSEKISPAEFADKIGVQRSSMSHILNGRNYPSAAFLQKMLQIYPRVNPRWLMIGEGEMNSEVTNFPITSEPREKIHLNANNPQGLFTDENSQVKEGIGDKFNKDPGIAEKNHSKPDTKGMQMVPGPEKKIDPIIHNNAEISGKPELDINDKKSQSEVTDQNIIPFVSKEIEQVIFFYKDKSFTVYRPN